MSAEYSITIQQGTDFRRAFQLKTDDVVTDITGYSFAGKIASDYKTSDITSFSSEIENAAQGTFSVGLSTAQTAALKPGRNVYDITMTDSDGKVIQLLRGVATVQESV